MQSGPTTVNCKFELKYGRYICLNCGRVLSRVSGPMKCPAMEIISLADEYPCEFRGEVVDHMPYKCGYGWQPLFECSEFGSCTVMRYKHRQPEKCCSRCEKRQPPPQ